MKKILLLGTLALAAAANANAQDLLAGKTAYTLGEAKTWSKTTGEGEEAVTTTYTFDVNKLPMLTQEPRNTSNIYLFPEEGGNWVTDANKEIGIQGFYIDMEESQEVGTVATTWEGATAKAFNIYLTDEEPTLDILNDEPTFSKTDLGLVQEATFQMPEGAKGRYLVFQPTEALDWGWGVKIRSISATAPAADELTTFTVSPLLTTLNKETTLTLSFMNQNNVDIDADKVTVTVSDNATYENGVLIINSGEYATFSAQMDDVILTQKVYAVPAPGAVNTVDVAEAWYVNGDDTNNDTMIWTVAYNGGATNNGQWDFEDGEVCSSFSDVRNVIFGNSNFGGWKVTLTPTESKYGYFCVEIFPATDCTGTITFEDFQTEEGATTTANTAVNLEAGQWNNIMVSLDKVTSITAPQIRLDEANMTDMAIANIYFAKEGVYTGVEAVAAEAEAPVEYYNINGIRVNGELAPGLYIRRQGNKTSKILVK